MSGKNAPKLIINDGDGCFYVRDGIVYHNSRGQKSEYKRFQSDAEAEAFLLRMAGIEPPRKERKTDAVTNEKHKKSHRLKRPK